jgi:hypothetical protein
MIRNNHLLFRLFFLPVMKNQKMRKLWMDHHRLVNQLEETSWVFIYYISPVYRYISFIGNGPGGKAYGGMTEELSDDDENDDQMQMGRGGVGMNDEDEELDVDIDPRKRGGGDVLRRPNSASGQRRQKRQPQQRETYDDDENF